MRAVSDLATRLLAVDWTVDYDEPVELTKQRIVHFRTYLARVAPYAELLPGAKHGTQRHVPWPWFDAAACVDPSIRADDAAIEAVTSRVEGIFHSGVRDSCGFALHFAALRDADAVPRDLSDPFEPLVRVYELGGPISRDCSGLFMEFGCTAAVPIRDQKFWAEAAR